LLFNIGYQPSLLLISLASLLLAHHGTNTTV
jgi:hypothetical protein